MGGPRDPMMIINHMIVCRSEKMSASEANENAFFTSNYPQIPKTNFLVYALRVSRIPQKMMNF